MASSNAQAQITKLLNHETTFSLCQDTVKIFKKNLPKVELKH